MSHLALTGSVRDEAGMASAVLAREVDYPGSSIAFAQLLSGMERAGLIEREVRGKRTYRISPAASALAGLAAAPARRGSGRRPGRTGPAPRQPRTAAARRGSPAPEGDLAAGGGLAGFDYDELARRLLVQVVRHLAPTAGAAAAAAIQTPADPDEARLANTVADLERELAGAKALHDALTTENARLREQLHAARRSLALARERERDRERDRGRDRDGTRPVTEQLDRAEFGLLERLLSPAAEEPGHRQDADAG
ncbi:MAG TPA: hypothetical protein VGL63_15075 [Streptosporangiaceae bacterium]